MVIDPNGPRDVWLKSVGDLNGDTHPDQIPDGEGLCLADIDRDKDQDVVIGRYWFENPGDIADFDQDGRLDVATAEMQQGTDPDEVSVYLNLGGGKKWAKNVISTNGSHSMRIVDVDGDGRPDLYGANWHGATVVELWKNMK